MTLEEREEFREQAIAIAAAAHARGEDVAARLAPLFESARRQHPEDSGWLLGLRDRLTDRPVL